MKKIIVALRINNSQAPKIEFDSSSQSHFLKKMQENKYDDCHSPLVEMKFA